MASGSSGTAGDSTSRASTSPGDSKAVSSASNSDHRLNPLLRAHTRPGTRVEVRGKAGEGGGGGGGEKSGSEILALEPSRPVQIANFKEVYDIQAEIGHGSYAVVYRASDRSGQVYALKSVIRAKLTARLQQSLQSEISLLLHFKQPHIVELKAVEEDLGAGVINLVMEYCSMGDLSGFIKRGALGPNDGGIGHKWPGPSAGGLHVTVVRHLLQQLGSALQYLSEQNCIHRDIKPQNLLLSPTESAFAGAVPGLPRLKVADFGFARFLKLGDVADTLCGSPLYMAPEILAFKTYDRRADLWSVGAVLYEMTTGRPPFRADNHVQLAARIKEAKDRILFPDEVEGWSTTKQGQPVPMPVKMLIRSLLKRDPENRLTFAQFLAHSVVGLDDMRRSGATYVKPITVDVPRKRQDAPPQLRRTSSNQATTAKRIPPPRPPEHGPVIGLRGSGHGSFPPKYVVDETASSEPNQASVVRRPSRDGPAASFANDSERDAQKLSSSKPTSTVPEPRSIPREGIPSMPPLRRESSEVRALQSTRYSSASPETSLTRRASFEKEEQSPQQRTGSVSASQSLVEREYVMVDKNQMRSISTSPLEFAASPKMPPYFRRPSMSAAYAGAAGAIKRLSFGRTNTSPMPLGSPASSHAVTIQSQTSPRLDRQPSHISPAAKEVNDIGAFSTSIPSGSFSPHRFSPRSLPDRSMVRRGASPESIVSVNRVPGMGTPPSVDFKSGSRAVSLGSASGSSALSKAISLNAIRLFGTSPKLLTQRYCPESSDGSGIWTGGESALTAPVPPLPGSVDQVESTILTSLRHLGIQGKAVEEFSQQLLKTGDRDAGFVMLVKSLECYQKAIERAQLHWSDQQGRSPSIEFSDTVHWLKVRFEHTLGRAERIRTSDLETSEGPDPNTLLYNRALETSQFGLAAELNRGDLAICHVAYSTSVALLEVVLADAEAQLPLPREQVVTLLRQTKLRISALEERIKAGTLAKSVMKLTVQEAI